MSQHRHSAQAPCPLSSRRGGDRLWRATLHLCRIQSPRQLAGQCAACGPGIGRGDKVATILGNSLEIMDAYWACAALGVIIVPMSPLLRGAGLTLALLNDSDSETIITSPDFAAILDPLRDELPLVAPDRTSSPARPGLPGYRTFDVLTTAASDADHRRRHHRRRRPVQHLLQQRHDGSAQGHRPHPLRAHDVLHTLRQRVAHDPGERRLPRRVDHLQRVDADAHAVDVSGLHLRAAGSLRPAPAHRDDPP